MAGTTTGPRTRIVAVEHELAVLELNCVPHDMTILRHGLPAERVAVEEELDEGGVAERPYLHLRLRTFTGALGRAGE